MIDPITATGFRKREARAIRAFLLASTVPLTYQDGDLAGVQGMGCLFDVSGVLYFVTAGHVLKGISPLKLGVPSGQADSDVLPLGSGLVGWSLQDEYDVAAYRIDDVVVAARLREAYIVLSVTNTVRQSTGVDHFIIPGYPYATAIPVGNTIKPKDITQIHTTRYEEAVVGTRSDFDLFLKLSLTAESLWHQRRDVPVLKGISGAPVWQVHESGSAVWVPESVLCLVGIQVSCDEKREKYIRALKWPVVQAALTKLAPGLN